MKNKYQFYFWLDLTATITLLLDIGWITDQMYGDQNITLTSAAQIKKIGQASRVGRRAARVIRIIRLVRLVKLYKHA
jgi:hypothetical protein